MISPKAFFRKLKDPDITIFELEAILKDDILCYSPSMVELFLKDLEWERKLWDEEQFHIAWELLFREWKQYEDNVDGIRDELKDDPPRRPSTKEAEELCEKNKSIDSLPRLYDFIWHKLQSVLTHNVDTWELPGMLDTERARKYFDRAIKIGWMKPTSSGFQWIWGGNRGKARLAYFIEKVYCPSRFDSISPEQRKEIELLFGIVRLDRAMQQNDFSGKTEAVKKWKAEIDSMFKDD